MAWTSPACTWYLWVFGDKVCRAGGGCQSLTESLGLHLPLVPPANEYKGVTLETAARTCQNPRLEMLISILLQPLDLHMQATVPILFLARDGRALVRCSVLSFKAVWPLIHSDLVLGLILVSSY